jgi:MFS transporter, MHS family, alpha-ketoglutarate permease
MKQEKISAQRLKAIIGGSIGNLVEWYDWYAYSALSLYFSGAFFPEQDTTAQLLNTGCLVELQTDLDANKP